MSWKSAARSSVSSSELRQLQLPADRKSELLHPARVPGRVGVARVDGGREGRHRRGRALAEELVRPLEREVLGLDRLGRRPELLGRALRVHEVRLLRLPHQHERHGDDGEGVEADRGVGDRDHRSHEAVDDVVGREPREPLAEDPPGALVALHGRGDADQGHVDEEVDTARGEAEPRQRRPASRHGLGERGEHGRSGHRGERERSDVEGDVVERVPACAPVDDGARDRQRQGGTVVEERGAGERSHGADGDRALDHVERQCLADRDEGGDCEQPDHVPARPGEEAGDAGAGAGEADDRDDRCEPAAQGEERRHVECPRPGGVVRLLVGSRGSHVPFRLP